MNESIVRIKIPCVFIANMNMEDNILYDRGMCFYFLIKIEKKLWSVCTYFGHSFYYKNSHLFMTCCALFSFLMFIMWLLHSSTSNTWRAIKIVNTLIFDFWHLGCWMADGRCQEVCNKILWYALWTGVPYQYGKLYYTYFSLAWYLWSNHITIKAINIF